MKEPDPDLVRQLESDIERLTYQLVVSAGPLGSPLFDILPAAVAQAGYRTVQGGAQQAIRHRNPPDWC